MEKTRQLVRSNKRVSTGIVIEELNLDRGTVIQILPADLESRKFSVKMVLRILKDE